MRLIRKLGNKSIVILTKNMLVFFELNEGLSSICSVDKLVDTLNESKTFEYERIHKTLLNIYGYEQLKDNELRVILATDNWIAMKNVFNGLIGHDAFNEDVSDDDILSVVSSIEENELIRDEGFLFDFNGVIDFSSNFAPKNLLLNMKTGNSLGLDLINSAIKMGENK